MFSSGSETLTEKKSTWRYQYYINSTDVKLLFDFLAPSGHKNSLNATSLWFGKNRAMHPTLETLSCSETNPATSINFLLRDHCPAQEEEWQHYCRHHWVQERSGRQNHLCQQISTSSLAFHESGDCRTSGEDYWSRLGWSSWNYSSRSHGYIEGDPGWDFNFDTLWNHFIFSLIS